VLDIKAAVGVERNKPGRCIMRRTFCYLFIIMLPVIAGCSGGRESVAPFRSFGGYVVPADAAAKDRLEADLRSGKTGLGSGIAVIKKAYGEPDEVSAAVDSTRFVYKRKDKPSIVLWFDIRGLLSSWSD